MGNSGWCMNPHTRVELITLFSILSESDEGKKDVFGFLFKSNIISDKYLMNSLINIFIDAEKTGSSHQFYEKFNLRY